MVEDEGGEWEEEGVEEEEEEEENGTNEDNDNKSLEEIRGEGSKKLSNKKLRNRALNKRNRPGKRAAINIENTGVAKISVHVTSTQPHSKIYAYQKSFVCYADNARKNVVAVVKFFPFKTMDPARKAEYEYVSRNMIANTQFQDPNKSNGFQLGGQMFSLGWRKAYESKTKLGIQGTTADIRANPELFLELGHQIPRINAFIGERFKNTSLKLYKEVKAQHQALNAPGLSPFYTTDDNCFTCHLSYTINGFYNKPHKDNDASPYSFVTWIPINKETGDLIEENFEVEGGSFVFPDNGVLINFEGFDGIVECAWKATQYTHCTVPSTIPQGSSHTRLGYSVQLPKKTQRALHNIKNGMYAKGAKRAAWTFRDAHALVGDSMETQNPIQ